MASYQEVISDVLSAVLPQPSGIVGVGQFENGVVVANPTSSKSTIEFAATYKDVTTGIEGTQFVVAPSDGTMIAFYSDRDGDPEIYVMNADGSNQTRLTFSPRLEADLAWFGD